MEQIQYNNEFGDFSLENAQNAASAYLPLVNPAGMMSSVTPSLSGDCKTGQNTFLLEPASELSLTQNRATRNFWVMVEGQQPWSAVGQSAPQLARRFTPEEEVCRLQGGLLWQQASRTQEKTGLRAEVLSFVPAPGEQVEIFQTTLTNGGSRPLRLRCAAAVPVFGRSADNLRDHRHVTSLLQRGQVETFGLTVTQTLTFDERGHQPGRTVYHVWASDERGAAPAYAVPLLADFVGSGTCDWPQAVVQPEKAAGQVTAGGSAQGGELMAALFFPAIVLSPGACVRYQTVLAIDSDPTPYLTPRAVTDAWEQTKRWWREQAEDAVYVADPVFTPWLRWVAVQPVLRRICGCSFLPHHDYGRGGRGWRDLWQDSLALLLAEPGSVRSDLLSYFGGIRTDGTNATIIGTRPGEFRADRNNIPRVWMDHGFWPLLTTALYLDETGDTAFLLERQPYFSDDFAFRGERPQTEPAAASQGTVLEHLLIENATAFFDVGEHGHMRLRGADWNDGLDMAPRRGESVAFTAAYAGNFDTLAELLERLSARGHKTLLLSDALAHLLSFNPERYGDPEAMRAALFLYCRDAAAAPQSREVSSGVLGETLRRMASWLRWHIRQTEWVGDGADQHWFNSYYDDSGRQVEGVFGKNVRMMLTGQVFALLSGTAEDAQVPQVIRAVDWYLCQPSRGGCCLNTDFEETKTDLGRMFGFAYGSKENGAVFCHMAVLYAYALYQRGCAAEGWKVLEQLYLQSVSSRRSGIFPGIPEYFDLSGRGMYPYLTGAASWFLLTVRTEMFGIKGHDGDLWLEPKLTAAQFDERRTASLRCRFGGRVLEVTYHNPALLEWGDYRIGALHIGDRTVAVHGQRAVLGHEFSGGQEPCRIIAELEPLQTRRNEYV